MNLAETQKRFWEALRGGEHDFGPRMQIYSDMYFFRQIDALREDFPETAARLGDEAFFERAKRYILDHPSEDPDLGRLGRHFGAPLEWARSEVFLEAEVPRMKPEDFAQRLTVKIVPALRLVDHTVVWRAPGAFELHEVDLPNEEAAALALAMKGASFDEICAAFLTPEAAYEALQSWLAEGWIQDDPEDDDAKGG